MNRKEFLAMLGMTAGGVVAATCLGSCSKNETSSNVDFTIDLNDSAYSTLNNNGGYVIKSGVIIARTSAGAYIAVSAACTHEGTNVQYQAASNRFHCPSHGANFSSTGAVQSGPTNTALKQYNTTLSGTTLRVYS
jgi:cytochrome b6-f complex iron-sulfur subunit